VYALLQWLRHERPHVHRAGWSSGVGFVSPQVIKEQLPAPADDVLVLRCGPLAMNKAMEAHLDALGYSKESQFQF
jgi:cytochrome-b5 reductase